MIMNLAVNARDAMPEGGRLCIGVDTMEFAREKEAPLPGMKPGRWVRLTVNDTGVGIAPTDIEHVFEPFFTTKPIGVGTGLGLPQVHGIVGQHNGHVTIESAVGSGTICTIYLPVLAMLTPGVVETISSLTHANGHGETILVVEDEEALRRTLKEVLEQWNYHVVDVGNGQEALNALDDGLRPDLILSDVVMPEMSGLALFKAMRKRELDIPLIFLTGHLRGEELDNLRQVGLRAWLPKPPSIAQLAETITSILH
jgi:CheY-like chemotaxis protein